MYKSILVCDLFDVYRSIPLPVLHKLDKKNFEEQWLCPYETLHRFYIVVDFTLHRYTVDALVMQGVRGESSKPLKKCAASRIKNESEMKNVCKAKKEKS